jgi:predicted restriction endonuclease
VSWLDGGETVIDNLCLLCRYHHTKMHLGLISIEDLEIRSRVLVGVASDRST